MRFLSLSSIRNKLALIVIVAVLPALVLLLYSGFEQRQHSIERAKHDVLLLTQAMAQAQKEVTRSTRIILSTISVLPEIQAMDLQASSDIFRTILENNTSYSNMTLTGLDGEVLAAGRAFTRANLADRKHFREALERNDFVVGEYIISRVGQKIPAFAFAYPVSGKDGRPKAILTAAIKLSSFAGFHNSSALPKKSFVAVTDQRGIRLFYYPIKKDTNPVGKPIRARNWDRAIKAKQSGLLLGKGSDGIRRIIAFEQIRLTPEDPPYLYVWAGIPEAHILLRPNVVLIRNLMIMALAAIASLLISWVISKKTLISPINSLVNLARKFAQGDLGSRRELTNISGELGTLTNAFYDMADSLTLSQKKLKENEERLRTVADFAYDWVYWIGPDGKLEYISPSCQRITGYSSEEFLLNVNLLATICLNEDRVVAYNHISEERVNEEAPTTIEFRILTKEGKIKWINHFCQPIIGADGKFLGRRGSNRDISDQKKSLEEKEKLEERLQQAQKMEAIGTLAGGIAHDFNNILGAIIGYTEMARDDSPPESSIAKDLDKVLEASNRATNLVQQILSFSRQDDSERVLMQPASIVKKAITMLRPTLPTTIEISQDIDSKTGLLFANPTQIHQILMNLCTNAFHAMEEKGGRLDISLKQRDIINENLLQEPHVKAGLFIQLSVCDSGPGIPLEIKEKLFDPYFTTKEVGKGTGMGLSIAHGIVKSYGGFITLYSEPGEGAAFHVFLPVINEEVLLNDEEIKHIPIGREKIFFIDDEDILAEMGKNMIERLGYRVTVQKNSLKALEIFREDPDQFDLIITDQTMPGITGIDLARRMLQIRPDIPIILCTGYSSIVSKEKAKSMGIREFTLKPITKNDIAILIRKVLDGDKNGASQEGNV